MNEREPGLDSRKIEREMGNGEPTWYSKLARQVRKKTIPTVLTAATLAGVSPAKAEQEVTPPAKQEVANQDQEKNRQERVEKLKAIVGLMTLLRPSKVEREELESGGYKEIYEGEVPPLVTPIKDVIESDNIDNDILMQRTKASFEAISRVAQEVFPDDPDKQTVFEEYNRKMMMDIFQAGPNTAEMPLGKIIEYLVDNEQQERYFKALVEEGLNVPEKERQFVEDNVRRWQSISVSNGVDHAIEQGMVEKN